MIVNRNRLIKTALLTIALALALVHQAQAETSKVLIVPFSIHSDKDLTFLRKGITAMLSSRLTDLGKVVVIDESSVAEVIKSLPTPLTREAAAEAGRKAGADYVAFGSLTVFGDSISTDARFLEASTASLLVTFNETGQNQGDVIGHINHFAEEVNTRIFGRSSTASVSAAPSPAPAPAATDPDQANPEKKIWSGGGGMQIRASNPDVDEADAKLWRSRRFPMDIEGLAMGDVDGDGDVEVVFASENQASVYRYKDARFLKVADIQPMEPYLICLGVDVADINGNGRAEIFMTARSENYFPHSYVLEWDGAAFQTIYDAPNWYFRVLWDPHSKRQTLYGQKGGAREVVAGPVWSMSWINGAYEPQNKIVLPNEASVFGFHHRRSDRGRYGRHDGLCEGRPLAALSGRGAGGVDQCRRLRRQVRLAHIDRSNTRKAKG